MIRIFAGFDQREAKGFHAFVQSVIENTSEPVAITPLFAREQRDGTNAFTYSRFLVPYLCDFQGFAIYADGSDMIAMGDLAELWAMRCGRNAVQVVKHDYKTKHARKYVDTEMEAVNQDYLRKNWSSLILWDCGHYQNRVLTPDFVAKQDGAYLHRFGWLSDERIRELPVEWNWLADEYGMNYEAKLLHFSSGIPAIWAYRRTPHAADWQHYSAKSMQAPAARIAEIASER